MWGGRERERERKRERQRERERVLGEIHRCGPFPDNLQALVILSGKLPHPEIPPITPLLFYPKLIVPISLLLISLIH